MYHSIRLEVKKPWRYKKEPRIFELRARRFFEYFFKKCLATSLEFNQEGYISKLLERGWLFKFQNISLKNDWIKIIRFDSKIGNKFVVYQKDVKEIRLSIDKHRSYVKEK